MNKIFKVIWNHSAQRFDVCSELTHSHGKSASSTDERGSVIKTIAISALTAGAVLGSADVMAAISVGEGTAQGTGATATLSDSIVIGNNAKDDGENGEKEIIIGNNARTEKTLANSSGPSQNNPPRGSIVIGDSAVASTRGSVVIGQNANATFQDSRVDGRFAVAAPAMGFRLDTAVAAAPSNNVVVIGNNASAFPAMAMSGSSGNAHISYRNPYNILWAGASVAATGENNKVLDIVPEDEKWKYNAFVKVTNLNNNNVLRSTINNDQLNAQTVAVGNNATADVASIAIGSEALALGGYVGTTAFAQGVALGHGAYSRTGSIVIGGAAAGVGANSLAFGRQAATLGDNAIAIGATTAAVGNQSMAFGHSSTAIGNHSMAFGASNSPNNYDEANATITLADDSVAMGYRAKTYEEAVRSIALGQNASAHFAENVILGSESSDTSVTNNLGEGTGQGKDVNDATVNGISYSGFAGSSLSTDEQSKATVRGVVSVGATRDADDRYDAANYTRQIVNVAPGEISIRSTDAINGSQLYLALTESYWNTHSDSATYIGDVAKDNSEINFNDTVKFEAGLNVDLTKNVTADEEGKETVTYTYSTVENPVFNNVTTGGDVKYFDKDGNELTPNGDGTFTNAAGDIVDASEVDPEKTEVTNPIFMGKDDKDKNVVSGLDSHLPKGGVDEDGKPVTDVKTVANPYSADNPAPVTEAATLGDVLNAGWNLRSSNGSATVEDLDFVTPYNTVEFKQGSGITISTESDGDTSTIEIKVNTSDLDPEYVNPTDSENPSSGTPTGKIAVPTSENDGLVTATTVANAINAAGWLTNSTSASLNEDEADTLINAGDQVNFEKGQNLELTKQVTKDEDTGKETVTYTYSTVMNPVFENVTTGGDVTYVDEDGNELTKNADGTYTKEDGTVVPAANVSTKVENPIVMGKDKDGDNAITGLDSHLPAAVDADGNPLTVKYVTDPDNPDAEPTAVYYNEDGTEYTGTPTDVTKAPSLAKPTYTNSELTEAATLNDVLNAGWNLRSSNGSAAVEDLDFVTPYNTVEFKQGNGITITTESDGDTSTIEIKVDNGSTTVDPTTGKALPNQFTQTDEDGKPVTLTLKTDESGNPVYDADGNPTYTMTNDDGSTTDVVPTPEDLTKANDQKVATVGDVVNTINSVGWFTNSTSASVNEDDADTLINAGDQVNFEKGQNLELTKQVTKDEETGKETVTYTYSTVMNPVFENVTTGGDVTYADKEGNPVAKDEDGNWVVVDEDGNPVLDKDGKPTIVNPSDVVSNVANPIFMGKNDKDNNVVSGLDSHLPAAVDDNGNPLTVKYVTDPDNPDAEPTAVYYNADGTEYTGTPTDVTKAPKLAKPTYSNSELTEAATLNDVLNAGWNLRSSNGSTEVKDLDFVTPYNTVEFKQGNGITITTESDGDTSTIEIKVNTTGLSPELNPSDTTNPVTDNTDPANPTTGTQTGKIETPENDNFVTGKTVAAAINAAGWRTNSTTAVETTGENDVTGEKAENTNLVNAGDQVNFEAGKNMEITKEVAKGDNDEDVITYTYRTAEEVDFNKVTLSTDENPTDEAGNPLVKVGDQYYAAGDLDENGQPKEDAAPYDGKVLQPTTVNLVSEQGTPVNNAGTGQEDTQTPPALNITGTDADGNPSPTQLTGVASVLNTKPTDTAPAGSTDGNPTATSPLLDLGDVDENGKSSLPDSVLNSAVTVGDLVNMGWVVSAADNNYTDVVKNANEVKFNGDDLISVTGETVDGVRNINISVKTGDVVTTNSEQPTDENGNPLVKVGDQYYAAGDVTNGVPNSDAAPYTGPVTQTTTNGTGFVTGNQVGDAIQESGWTVAINNDAAGETVRTPDQIEKVNPNDNVRFADGSNTQVRMITKEVIEPNGVNTTTTTVRIDAVVPTVYTDKNGNKVAQAADGNWYTLDENGLPNTAATPVPAGDIIASMVNPTNAVDNPTAGSPTTLSNLASTLPGAEGVAAGDVGVEDGDISPAATKRAAPTLTAAQKSNAATVDDVLNAGWNLQENGAAKDFVKSYDTVNFANGTGTEVNITTSADGLTSDVVVNVKTENSDTITLGVNPATGNIQANAITAPLNMEGTTDANGNPVTDDAGNPVTTGRVVVPTNPNALVTASQVANAINNSGFDLDIGSEGTGTVTANDEKAARVNPGTKVTVNAGNNIEIKRSGSDITIATSSNPVFENIQIGGSTGPVISSTANGDVKIAKANGAPARITNVAAGVDPMDAVNVQQFKDGLRAVDKRARRGIATAAAMGHLPQPHLDGHSMFSVGTVSYRGEQGIAVGYSRISDNGKHIIKLSGATNTSGHKDVMVGASYGYEW